MIITISLIYLQRYDYSYYKNVSEAIVAPPPTTTTTPANTTIGSSGPTTPTPPLPITTTAVNLTIANTTDSVFGSLANAFGDQWRLPEVSQYYSLPDKQALSVKRPSRRSIGKSTDQVTLSKTPFYSKPY